MIMISYRKLIPCIYIAGGKAIKWFDDREVLADNVVELAKHYSDRGADELLIFDLSDSDDDHEASLNLLRQIHNVISIPMVAGGNIKRMEDVQRILYSGAKRVILNFSKPDSAETVSYTHLLIAVLPPIFKAPVIILHVFSLFLSRNHL